MTTLHYQQFGEGRDLILIHGLFGSMENLNMVGKGLQDNWRITSVDVRNHGQSFHKNSMEYSELASDVKQLLENLKIDSCHILGHSMGGKIAMQFALDNPDYVEKLVVADIAPVQYPAHHNHIIEGLKSIDLPSISSRKDADTQLAKFVEEPGVRQFLLRNLTQHKSADRKFEFKCNLTFIDECYHQIAKGYEGDATFDKPTLFVKGSESNYITAEHRAKIGKHFPNAKAKIIQGAGHWLHAEKTTAFNKIVSDFLVD